MTETSPAAGATPPNRNVPVDDWRFLLSAGADHMAGGRTDAAVEAFERAHRLNPSDLRTQMNLGAALLRAKRPADALKLYSGLRVCLPSVAGVHHGLGLALFGLGDRDGALESFWNAAFQDPDAWRAWSSIAETTPDEDERLRAIGLKADALVRICERSDERPPPLFECVTALIDAQRFDAAAQLTRSRAPEFQRPSTANDLLARIAYRRGRFQEALHFKRNAFLQLAPGDIGAGGPAKLDPGRALGALQSLTELLDRHGIRHFLAAGTLLGFVRDGGPLPYDRDVDIGILPRAGNMPDIVSLLRSAADVFLPVDARPGDRYIGIEYHGVAVDFFVHRRRADRLICGVSDQPGDIQWRFSNFGVKLAHFQGAAWSIPDAPEQYLSESYGANWLVPDRAFASALSSPALFQVDPYTRAYYAVGRAMRMARAGNTEKAAALLKQSPIPQPDMDTALARLVAAHSRHARSGERPAQTERRTPTLP